MREDARLVQVSGSPQLLGTELAFVRVHGVVGVVGEGVVLGAEDAVRALAGRENRDTRGHAPRERLARGIGDVPQVVGQLRRGRELPVTPLVAVPALHGVPGLAASHQSLWEFLGAVAVRISRGEDAAAAGPHAVVADLDAAEGGDQIEGTEALGSNVRFDLQVQHVVPLGEIPVVVLPLVALDDGPGLHAVEAVNRKPVVPQLDRCDRRRQNHQRGERADRANTTSPRSSSS